MSYLSEIEKQIVYDLLTCGKLSAKGTKENEKRLTDTENTQMIAKGDI